MGGNRIQPRPAILIRQWLARSHFRDIRRRVEAIRIGKGPTQRLGQ
jgi:hypothetical protein